MQGKAFIGAVLAACIAAPAMARVTEINVAAVEPFAVSGALGERLDGGDIDFGDARYGGCGDARGQHDADHSFALHDCSSGFQRRAAP